MKVVYQGQIGAVVGLSEEEIESNPLLSVADVIRDIALAKGREVALFLVDTEDEVRNSLFVALDGKHVTDFKARVGDASEMLLLPPIAGG